MFLLRILIFKELTVRRLYKSFGVKGLIEIRCRINSAAELRYTNKSGS
jgi:hypothetical protein